MRKRLKPMYNLTSYLLFQVSRCMYTEQGSSLRWIWSDSRQAIRMRRHPLIETCIWPVEISPPEATLLIEVFAYTGSD